MCLIVTADMESTKRLLVQCANNLVPISLILVGVGKGDMRDMNLLDADRQTLSYRGVKARRDLVQFVGKSETFYRNCFLSCFRHGGDPEERHCCLQDSGEVWIQDVALIPRCCDLVFSFDV